MHTVEQSRTVRRQILSYNHRQRCNQEMEQPKPVHYDRNLSLSFGGLRRTSKQNKSIGGLFCSCQRMMQAMQRLAGGQR